MSGARNKLSKKAWLRVYRLTGLLTAVSVVLSVVITNALMETFSAGINVPGLMVAIIMPFLLGTPAIGFVLFKHEQLRAANKRLEQLATTDWLTGCLNRGAFTANVSAQLAATNDTGALLVIDVDYFKSINDRFGHDRGDDALRLIARALTGSLQPGDLLGRLGGEEFGLFIPHANEAIAAQRAEAARQAVARLGFLADGELCSLSVSVGGAAFAGVTDFRTLYRRADDYLYRAKAAGRDCVAVTTAA